MIGHQLTLIRRELWEHRSIFVTPIAIAALVVLGVLAMIMFASGFAKEVDLAIFFSTNVADESHRAMVLAGVFGGTSGLFLLGLAVLSTFYCLDSLYTERKDKSILFWRSLPVTDAETVISKLLTAVIAIPLVFIAVIIVTNIVNLIVISIWVSMNGGSASVLIWQSAPFLDNWLATLIAVLALALWVTPYIGWFLFVSAYVRRWPFMVAFLPPLVIMLAEWIINESYYLAKAVFVDRALVPVFDTEMDFERFFKLFSTSSGEENVITMLGQIDLLKFFMSPGLWGGFAVCAVFVAGSIYVRRFRDES